MCSPGTDITFGPHQAAIPNIDVISHLGRKLRPAEKVISP